MVRSSITKQCTETLKLISFYGGKNVSFAEPDIVNFDILYADCRSLYDLVLSDLSQEITSVAAKELYVLSLLPINVFQENPNGISIQ